MKPNIHTSKLCFQCVEGLTDKQMARPNKTFKNFLFPKWIIKIISICDIWGPEFVLKWDHFCFTILQFLVTISPGNFGGGYELCKLRSWV